MPWEFDEEAVDVLRRFTQLKMRLMPYLAAAAEEAHGAGVPIMRPMVLEFPDDPACAHLDRQYMLGGDLLVAPVMSDSGDVTYYVPAGTWTDVLRGEEVRGPAWVTAKHGFDTLPLLARPGAVVPFGAVADRPDYAWADGVELRAYAPAAGQRTRVRVPDPDGGDDIAFEVVVPSDGGPATAAVVAGSCTAPRVRVGGGVRSAG